MRGLKEQLSAKHKESLQPAKPNAPSDPLAADPNIKAELEFCQRRLAEAQRKEKHLQHKLQLVGTHLCQHEADLLRQKVVLHVARS